MLRVIDVVQNGEVDYSVTIENNLLNNVGSKTRKLTAAARAAVICDSNVAPLYLEKVAASFKSAGFETYTFVFPAGEINKTFDTVNLMLEFLCKNRFTRDDIAVALGGGVCGDLVGFASAIYLRGIDFVQIPTSLLAQIDSSIGGKTGCDLPFGKNLCGAFHNPLAVFTDPAVLKTLPSKFLNDGMSEAIKTGAVLCPGLFENLESEPLPLYEIISKCAETKALVVGNDFKEHGKRILLNFGHTIGHAIEKYENFNGLSHGEAVSVGMVMITAASEKAGLTAQGTTEKLKLFLEKFKLPTKTDIPLEKLCEICANDKKSRGNSINLVLLSSIGHGFVKSVKWDQLYDFLKC